MTPADTPRPPTPATPRPLQPAQLPPGQVPPLNDPDEALWQRQEAARLGLGGDAADRLIARALAQRQPVDLPADFATRLAQMVGVRRPPSPTFEWALAGLAAALLALAAGVALHLDPDLAAGAPMALAVPAGNGWLLWLAVALAAASIRPSILRSPRRP